MAKRGPAPARPESDPDTRRWEAGLAAFGRRDWAGALAAWKHCGLPQARPAQAEALLRRALSTQGRAAVADLRAAMALAPADARYPYHLGRVLAAAGDSAALEALEQATLLAPEEPRYRQTRDLVQALLGASGGGQDARARLLAADVAAGADGLPSAWPGAPAWVPQLLGAMAALAQADWSGAMAAADAVLAAGAELPGEVGALARYWGLWARALAHLPAEDVEVPGHPWPSGSARLQRWLLAARLDQALSAGDARLAATLWKRFAETASPARDVRDLVTARLGAAWARQGDWQAALECFRAVERRYHLSQAVAVAAERAGNARAALEAWGQVVAAAERGQLPPRVHDADAVRVVASGQQLRLMEAGAAPDEDEALRVRLAALEAQGDRAKVADLVELVCDLREAGKAPGWQWDRARTLAARALAQAPDNVDALREQCLVALLHDDLPTAWDAQARLAERLPGHEGAMLRLLELAGRVVLRAILSGRPQDIPAYCARVEAVAVAVGEQYRDFPPLVIVREMSLALARRAQGGPLKTRKTAWDAMLRRNAPPSAYALRGVIELLGRAPAKAERWFERRREEGLETGELRLLTGFQLADIAYAHCWVHQLAAGPMAPLGPDCAQAPLCQQMWEWLSRAVGYAPVLARLSPPAVLAAACPALPVAHRAWAQRMEVRIRKEARAWKQLRRQLEEGEDLFEELANLSPAELSRFHREVLGDA